MEHKNKEIKLIRLTIRLDENTDKKLSELCKESDKSRSYILRNLINKGEIIKVENNKQSEVLAYKEILEKILNTKCDLMRLGNWAGRIDMHAPDLRDRLYKLADNLEKIVYQ